MKRVLMAAALSMACSVVNADERESPFGEPDYQDESVNPCGHMQACAYAYVEGFEPKKERSPAPTWGSDYGYENQKRHYKGGYPKNSSTAWK
ncbi:MAG: hypothetical protein MUF19_02495 [Candidatus Pacebacteria bacterium]|jgi:hypothetical protein|nr:hypothetical protein [Candidatus Paceibacterota bacterium]